MDPAVQNFLNKSLIPLRLAALNRAGWPVVLSLWYLLEDGALYCATPQTAKIVSYLEDEPRCGFEIAGDEPPYCGVRGRALATIDSSRGVEILSRLLARYLGDTDNPLAQQLLSREVEEVALKLQLQSLTTWNFQKRMSDSVPGQEPKICP